MLNQKTFGGFLIALGVAIATAFFALLVLDPTWAIIIATSALVIVVSGILFWLGVRVLKSTASQESDRSEKL